jgi:HK97 family phage portal protein
MSFFRKKALVQQKASAAASFIVQYVQGRPQHQRRSYDLLAKEVYRENVIANQCIRRIAVAAAGIDLKLFRGGEKNRAQIDSHPILDLLYRPNLMQGDDSFFRALYSTLLLGGEVFIERTMIGKAAKELYIHAPNVMTVIPGSAGVPSAYEYTTGSGKKSFPFDQISGKCDILHIKDFSPLDIWRGLSQAEPAAYAIDQHNEASAWNYALLQNGARPSGALMVTPSETNPSGSLSPQQFDSLKDQIQKSMSGGENAGKPLLLEGGLQWKEFSLSPKDMDFIESVNSAARNISLAFGVPPILLGIPGDSTFNNVREAKLALYEETIMPLVNYVLAEFNNWLAQIYGADHYLEIDKDSISALSLRKEELRRGLKESDWLTINEKRQADGLDAIEGGDVLLVQSSQIPIDQAGIAKDIQPPPLDASKAEYADYLQKSGMTRAQAEETAGLVYG